MRFLKSVTLKRCLVLVFVLMLGVIQAQEVLKTQQGQPVTIALGTCGFRTFGDLTVVYQLGKEGRIVTCVLYLSTQLVGVKTLLAESPVYDFDLVLGLGKASGSIQLVLLPSNQISTLNGAFNYTTAGGNDPFFFKGVFVGWYVSTIKQNTPFLLSDFICLPVMGR
jgi:hypothetical protein